MKKGGIIIGALFAVVFLSAFVAAKTLFGGATTSLADIFNSIGLDAGTLTKILLIILLWMVLFNIVHQLKLGGNWRTGSAIIALIMAILAFIYIPQEAVNAIVLQYGAMGATILTVIPFLIILWFSLSTDNLFMARITWIFYAFYYFGLFIFKMATENFPETATFWQMITSSQEIAYMIGFIAGIVVFFMLPYIRNLIFKGEMEKLAEKGKHAAAVRKTLIRTERENLEAFGGGQ